MNLTAHFTLDELVHSDDAVKDGIDNTPPASVVDHLQLLAVGLESVRTLLSNAPMHISSGYRCPQLNRAEHGANVSGFAADFECPTFGTPIKIVEFLEKSGLKFDQLIQEGTWVHISFAPTMRQQVLTAHFNSEHKATYSTGA
jgi:zinc D-Ala-D-Ala carboxypeptidase